MEKVNETIDVICDWIQSKLSADGLLSELSLINIFENIFLSVSGTETSQKIQSGAVTLQRMERGMKDEEDYICNRQCR